MRLLKRKSMDWGHTGSTRFRKTEHLGIDEQAALKLIENNELESLKVGKKRFVLGGHIVRWKARHPDGPNGGDALSQKRVSFNSAIKVTLEDAKRASFVAGIYNGRRVYLQRRFLHRVQHRLLE